MEKNKSTTKIKKEKSIKTNKPLTIKSANPPTPEEEKKMINNLSIFIADLY